MTATAQENSLHFPLINSTLLFETPSKNEVEHLFFCNSCNIQFGCHVEDEMLQSIYADKARMWIMITKGTNARLKQLSIWEINATEIKKRYKYSVCSTLNAMWKMYQC